MSGLGISLESPSARLNVLRLSGEFEGMGALEGKEKLLGFLNQSAASDFMLDMSAIEYIDSTAIGVLLDMAKAAGAKKMKFGLLNANESVKKVLVITKVDKILTLY